MALRLSLSAVLAAFILLVPTSIVSGVNYDEGVSPDLSGEPSSPTPFALDPGGNTLTGSAGPFDFDIVRLTVPVGSALTSLTLNAYDNPQTSVSFVGLVAGPVWTAGLGNEVSASALMGWAHIAEFGGTGLGADLLIFMSTAPLSPGFTRPVGPGEYSILIQDTDNPVGYSMTFQLSNTAIPGDFNGDSVVDGIDLAQWTGDFGVNDESDADNDGDTDGADFIIWQQHLGDGGAISTVPEPSAACIAICMAAACKRRRRATHTPR